MQIQKKIIALAIASALATPALALAEATVYGQINMSIDMLNDGAATNSTSANQLNSNTSRLGFKGAEDLSGGLSAIWQVEGTLGPDTGSTGTTDGIFDRNQYLGLKSDSMGTVAVGRMDSPYKSATRRFDLFGDGIADNRGTQVAGAATGSPFKSAMMGGGHDARLSNVIAYMSPTMNGVSVAVASVFGAETTGVPNATKGSAYSLAGMYEQGPIYGTLAYQTIKAGTVATGDLALGGTLATAFGLASTSDEAKATKLGVGYTMDMWQVNVVLEKVTATIAAVDKSQNDFYLSGKYNVSSTDAVKLAYAKIGDLSNNGAILSGAKQTTLGYDHSMSKATSVYALYSKKTANAANSAAPSVLSFGMKHSF